MALLSKIFGSAQTRIVEKLRKEVEKVNTLEANARAIDSEDFPEKTEVLRKRVRTGETLEDILPEAFSYVREVARRQLGQRHFDVQLMAGIALHRGSVIEMRTGEGKTLCATAPVYLNALLGKGVHVITVNDYLARRDAVWMGQIYAALGLSVGVLTDTESFLYQPSLDKGALDKERDIVGAFKVEQEFLGQVERKEAYGADIIYGTNHAFGFDYLRDNLANTPALQAAREYHYAIIDEVDSILIDEARTPLIISAPQEDASRMYTQFMILVRSLKPKLDYTVDEKRRSVILTQAGLKHVEALVGRNLYGASEVDMIFYLDQALKAHTLFLRDRDYVVKEKKVIIVDEFTGRLMPDRRFSEGLHQALEAKEGVQIQAESKTVATITIQNFFKKYTKLAGMTGTAQTSAEEFDKVYGLEVIVIPTHRTMVRKDLSDRIYKTGNAKWRAIVKEIRERHQNGQPILVGTVSVEKNEFLSKLLKKSGIPHTVLNAKHHESEGEVIAQAGRKGNVTVATNIAGRGVDIILGGNPPRKDEAEEIKSLGGLFVLGSERHEARRIDNQLRGRAGRQGDAGETQFFLSLEDDLMRIFGGGKIGSLMTRFNFPEDMPIENSMVSSSILRAQGQVEGYNFDIRKKLLEYDDVIARQRDSIYARRQEVLEFFESNPLKLKDKVVEILSGEIADIVHAHSQEFEEIKTNFFSITNEQVEFDRAQDPQAVEKELIEKIEDLYAKREEIIGTKAMRQIEKELLLRAIDTSWSDYLVSLDHLRQSVGLRGVGGHDPLVEFKREAKKSFDDLLVDIDTKVIDTIFKIQVGGHTQRPQEIKLVGNIEAEKPASVKISVGKVGRNDPCPCGSGKKFKKCHGR